MSDSQVSVKDCHYPWTWMMVTADGNVMPCCFAPGSLGNLNDASVEDIWNGPVAVELRSYIVTDRVHPVCAGAPCKFVQNMPRPVVPANAGIQATDLLDSRIRGNDGG